MNSRALITIMALVAGLVALTGCSDNSNELQRLVCEVEMVNDGSPLVSAAVNAGSDGLGGTEDDYVPIDMVPVVFRARTYNTTTVIPSDGTYSSFIVTNYDLVWTSTDPNAPAGLSDYNITNGLVSAKVPVDSDASVGVLVCPLEMKEATWFQALLNGAPPFTASAALTFKGHVSGTDHVVEIPAGLQTNFIGVVAD